MKRVHWSTKLKCNGCGNVQMAAARSAGDIRAELVIIDDPKPCRSCGAVAIEQVADETPVTPELNDQPAAEPTHPTE